MNMVVRLTSRDDSGAVVVEQYWSSLMRGPVTGGDQGDPMADHTFPDPARDRPVGAMVLGTTRDQPFRDPGASGDRAHMHVSDDTARRFGFPRKFHQGLCTLGVTSRGLVSLAARGDPRRIRRIAARFRGADVPGRRHRGRGVRRGPDGTGVPVVRVRSDVGWADRATARPGRSGRGRVAASPRGMATSREGSPPRARWSPLPCSSVIGPVWPVRQAGVKRRSHPPEFVDPPRGRPLDRLTPTQLARSRLLGTKTFSGHKNAPPRARKCTEKPKRCRETASRRG